MEAFILFDYKQYILGRIFSDLPHTSPRTLDSLNFWPFPLHFLLERTQANGCKAGCCHRSQHWRNDLRFQLSSESCDGLPETLPSKYTNVLRVKILESLWIIYILRTLQTQVGIKISCKRLSWRKKRSVSELVAESTAGSTRTSVTSALLKSSSRQRNYRSWGHQMLVDLLLPFRSNVSTCSGENREGFAINFPSSWSPHAQAIVSRSTTSIPACSKHS